MQKIPATIISGFLGSGKTSLIRHILGEARDYRFAFIINEFGDLGIDREILLGCGAKNCSDEDIVELSNGCICCTVADDFLPVMERLLECDPLPDHIIIETSGLALPKPLIKAFTWETIATRVTIDGVINVLDAKALVDGRFADDEAALAEARRKDASIEHDNPLQELFFDQLSAADIVVLNKCDLLSADDIASLRLDLQSQMRAETGLVESRHASLPVRVLLGIGAGAEADIANRPSHHDGDEEHEHDDFTSFVLSVPEISDMADFVARLERTIAVHDILRVKGFLHCRDAARRLVLHAVGGRIEHYFDRIWGDAEEKSGQLVIIGFAGLCATTVSTSLWA